MINQRNDPWVEVEGRFAVALYHVFKNGVSDIMSKAACDGIIDTFCERQAEFRKQSPADIQGL